MPITSSDIEIKTSSVAPSIGGPITSTDMPAAIFDNVLGAEAAAGDIEYRCVYVRNAHPTLTLEAAKVWLSSNTSGQIALGVGTSPVNGDEPAVASEDTAPAGVVFSAAPTEAAALPLGSIPAGQHKAVWMRRTIAPNTPAAEIAVELTVKGSTAA